MCRKYFICGIIVLVVLSIAGGIWNAYSAERKDIAPDFSAEDIDGKIFELAKFTDKPVVIQFMRVYCGGKLRNETIEQFKQLSRLYNKYKNEIIFVTVTISTCRTVDLKEIANKNNIEWTFINDYSDYQLDIIEKYSTYLKKLYDPALIFINRNREIAAVTNFCDDKKLDEYINLIIKPNKKTSIKAKEKNKK